MRGGVENTKRAGYKEPQATRHCDAPAIVHEQQVASQRNSQGYRGGLTCIEAFYGDTLRFFRRFDYVQPRRRIGDPLPDRRWSTGIGQLTLDGLWQEHSFKQRRKNLDVPDQH